MLGLSLFDVYMAATILGAGYVAISALLGNLDFSTGGDVGGGGADVGHDFGHDAGHDVGHDAGHDVSHDVGHDAVSDGGHAEGHGTGMVADATDEHRRAFGALSPTIIASFLAGFGAVGLVLQKGYGWDALSALPAAGGGVVLAGVFKAVFNKLALAASGSSHAAVRDLIGSEAEVTTPIGEHAPGEIAYVLSGARFSRSARSADGKPIGRGTKVTIEAIDGNQTYVLKADQS